MTVCEWVRAVCVGSQFSLEEWEFTDKQREGARIIHVIMDYNWKQYDELMFV